MANDNRKVKIPGELESAAVDGVVAAASAIYDYSKEKSQSEMNEDFSDAIEQIEEIDNRLTQVEEIGQLVLSNGEAQFANASDFNNPTSEQKAKAATVGSILDSMDAVPTAGSVKPVQSGGVQNELALGAVYDVSAKNPTAGPNNDGKWESLSTLLSDANLNTLIPTSVRRGGMSIKFVQSSDNKYMQYRLMSETFNTTVTNWQGVDDEPTAGSDNLVKSNGVAKSLLTANRININSGDSFVYPCHLKADIKYYIYRSGITGNYSFATKTDDKVTNIDLWQNLSPNEWHEIVPTADSYFIASGQANTSDGYFIIQDASYLAPRIESQLNKTNETIQNNLLRVIDVPANRRLDDVSYKLRAGVTYYIKYVRQGITDNLYNFATKDASKNNIDIWRDIPVNKWYKIIPTADSVYVGSGQYSSYSGYLLVQEESYNQESVEKSKQFTDDNTYGVESVEDAYDSAVVGSDNNRYIYLFDISVNSDYVVEAGCAGYLCYCQMFASDADARRGVNVIEQITSSWVESFIESFETTGIMRLTIKKTDNTEITSEDVEDIQNKIFIKVYNENNLNEKIDNETQRAQTAESALNTRINNIITGGSNIVRPIIWDCDNGWDIDDCVSARILAWGVRHKIVDLMGVVLSCNNLVNSVSAMDGLLCEEGIGECKIGAYPNSSHSYNMGYHTILADYPQHYQTESDAISDIELYRRALAQLPDGVQADVIITGYTNSFARFMQSPADSISNKTGLQLANTKIRKLWVMGGNFYDGTPELNFKTYPQDTKYILDNFTGDMYVQGHEIAVAGSDIIHAGEHLNTITSENDWLWKCLYNWNVTEGHDRGGCYAYDPMVVLAAMDDNEFATCLTYKRGIIAFDTETLRTSFTESPTGNHYVASRVLLSSEYTKRLDTILNKNIWINNQSKVFRLSI